jgi:crotonobetainyl-CoA:carnitine CoA-transferase CaiB-like acyl-CoA transferase
MALALEGIKIVDLTWVGSGIFHATTFGGLGADVIEVCEVHPERCGAPYTILSTPSHPGLRNCCTRGIVKEDNRR